MAISKSSIAAGVIGGGGGVVGTTLVAKYATSTDAEELKNIKEDISNKVKGNNDCVIRIKIPSSKVSQKLEEFNDREVLNSLLAALTSNSSSATSICSTAAADTANEKSMVAIKGDSNGGWTFKKWIKDVDEINGWTTSENRNCTLKIKDTQNPINLNYDIDNSKITGLIVFLKDNSKNTNAKNSCVNGKTIEVTKGSGENPNPEWSFTESTTATGA